MLLPCGPKVSCFDTPYSDCALRHGRRPLLGVVLQVYQAIRSCRGLAPMFIPGASELEKLVASAEAWASKACEVLKIKVSSCSRVLRPTLR